MGVVSGCGLRELLDSHALHCESNVSPTDPNLSLCGEKGRSVRV